jgi:hypothetical protein
MITVTLPDSMILVMKNLQQLLMNIAIEEKPKRTQDLTWFDNVSISTETRSFYFFTVEIGLHSVYL